MVCVRELAGGRPNNPPAPPPKPGHDVGSGWHGRHCQATARYAQMEKLPYMTHRCRMDGIGMGLGWADSLLCRTHTPPPL